jgi:hypothetical protein
MQGVHQEKGTPGGQEELIFKKSFKSRFEKILEMQGVCGKSKSSKDQAQKGQCFS